MLILSCLIRALLKCVLPGAIHVLSGPRLGDCALDRNCFYSSKALIQIRKEGTSYGELFLQRLFFLGAFILEAGSWEMSESS